MKTFTKHGATYINYDTGACSFYNNSLYDLLIINPTKNHFLTKINSSLTKKYSPKLDSYSKSILRIFYKMVLVSSVPYKKQKKTDKKNVSPATPQYDDTANPSTSSIKMRMMQQQNEELKQRLQQMRKDIQTLLTEKENDVQLIENLQQIKPRQKKRKSRKPPSFFDVITKRIAKKYLFPMIKFVSKSELENYQHNRSIGYHFLQALKKEDQVKDSSLFDGKDEVLWKNAQDLVKDSLSEKRNARQTQMKIAWKGSYLFITNTKINTI